METDQKDTLIFRDQAGDYYLLPLETLRRGRAPAELRAALEERLSATTAAVTAGQDVQGYVAPILVGIALGQASVLAGLGIAWQAKHDDPLGPLLQQFVNDYQRQQ